MTLSDTSEKGLELLIYNSLLQEAGYTVGDSKDFDRDHAIDPVKLSAFLSGT
jgi:type I restriction enzyme R subunit